MYTLENYVRFTDTHLEGTFTSWAVIECQAEYGTQPHVIVGNAVPEFLIISQEFLHKIMIDHKFIHTYVQ